MTSGMEVVPFSELAALGRELAALEARQLRRRRLRVEAARGPRLLIGGVEYLAFCSNDYLGLAHHPGVARAARAGIERYGVGAGASHLVSGHSDAHHRLEEALAKFVELPAALLFSTGYMANLAVVTTLASRGGTVLADRLNHASLNDAALLSRARFKRYAHGDLKTLRQWLAGARCGPRVVVTDAVFSMDGDVAPLPELLALCEEFDAWLVVDDAHGFGVLGPKGQGTLSHFGLRSSRIVYVGTLGKAAGVFGAFVAGDPAVVQTLIQRARPYIYTTALPPLLACALLESLRLIAEGDEDRARLRDHVARLRRELPPGPWRLMASETPIQPLVLGDNALALAASRALARRGILVPAIRPPTVPPGTARLRISLSAAHREEDVERLVEALAQTGQELAVLGTGELA
jgi:8-amino-7-oxononanoate synthase